MHQCAPGTKLVYLRIEGQSEPTGVTDNHPYWSVDRQEFIPAGELHVGELVDTEFGAKQVQSIQPWTGFDGLLYNLETTEHVFRVGTLGSLVHNACAKPQFTDANGQLRNADGTFASGGDNFAAARGRQAHQNYKNTLPGGYEFDKAIRGGMRPDAINLAQKHVRELKPNKPKAIAAGERQLEAYRKQLQKIYGGEWASSLDTYRP